MPERFIVAEITKNWVDGAELTPRSGLLCQQFEQVINVNDTRGYRLMTFQVSQVALRPDELCETIIAVFERKAVNS